MKFGRYCRLRMASRIRLRVRSGIEREAAELFHTADTVPGVSPRWSATDFKVTRLFFCSELLLLVVSMVGVNACNFSHSCDLACAASLSHFGLSSVRRQRRARIAWPEGGL